MPSDLDRAMAFALAAPSSEAVRALMREVRLRRTNVLGPEARKSSEEFYRDCSHLYRTTLSLESDPEIVSRNTLARVLSGIAPVTEALAEIQTYRGKKPMEVISGIVQIIAEIETASQYLASARLSTELHFRDNLMSLEERMMDLAESSDDPKEGILAVSSLMDSIRVMDMPLETKPFVPFVMWALVVVMDYKLFTALDP